MLLGRKVQDFDIATDALPEAVNRDFSAGDSNGHQARHGDGPLRGRPALRSPPFASTRSTGTAAGPTRSYSPRPSKRTSSAGTSRSTRSPTILRDGRPARPARGSEGSESRYHPGDRRSPGPLQEDGLRPLRACRFAAQFDFRIEAETFCRHPAQPGHGEAGVGGADPGRTDSDAAGRRPPSVGFILLEMRASASSSFPS